MYAKNKLQERTLPLGRMFVGSISHVLQKEPMTCIEYRISPKPQATCFFPV